MTPRPRAVDSQSDAFDPPKITSGGWDEDEEIAFSITDIGGARVDADVAIEWAKENKIAAFEQFSMLLDALSELHAAHIIHRNLTVATLRAKQQNGTTTFRLRLPIVEGRIHNGDTAN